MTESRRDERSVYENFQIEEPPVDSDLSAFNSTAQLVQADEANNEPHAEGIKWSGKLDFFLSALSYSGRKKNKTKF
jgi:hypothetical protein